MAIESPVDVLRRLREERRQEGLRAAESRRARVDKARGPVERAQAISYGLGQAFRSKFIEDQPDLEQDPAVLQAQQRQQWLSVAPDNVDAIRTNIKASAEAGDYEVANYLTKQYYDAQQLKLKEREVSADEVPTAPELQSKLGKQMSDVEKLEKQGKFEEAAELESRIVEQQAQTEAVAREKQMKTIDTVFGNTFGLDLEKDLADEEVGGQFQNMTESAMVRSNAGEKLPSIRKDIKKYFDYSSGTLGFGKGIELSDKAKKELNEGKIGMGRDADGTLGLYKLKDGVPSKFITWIDERFAED